MLVSFRLKLYYKITEKTIFKFPFSTKKGKSCLFVKKLAKIGVFMRILV
ncbi:hypothetical protein D932_00253 [Enterococcus casseliflavus 14-MB-W-14]|nr:hypothetical protein D932_00253 [Enterococcus casseliflavus 14-MB-W-14]